MRFILAALIVVGTLTPSASAQPADILLDDRAVAAGLRLSTVAADLNFPMGMTELQDGSLLVATSTSEAGDFYNSTGELVRLSDSDENGTFDQRSVLAADLPGSLVAVVQSANLVFATSAEGRRERIMIFRQGESWSDPLVPEETIPLIFAGAMHQSYALAVRPNTNDPEAIDLFFNIGAAGNDTAGRNVPTGGQLDVSLSPASIYMVTISDSSGVVSIAEPILIAEGLRNASALVVQPETGDLWIGENGIDGLINPIEAFSADELNRIPADDIGKTVHDFGFPESYVDYVTGEQVGFETSGIAFLPLDESEAEGIAGMTFIPDSFPAELAGGMLAGFHGQFDLTGLENEENPVRWIDIETGEQFDLISNESPGVGHIDSMIAVGDVVYLADFCQSSMANSPGCGVIYRLEAT